MEAGRREPPLARTALTVRRRLVVGALTVLLCVAGWSTSAAAAAHAAAGSTPASAAAADRLTGTPPVRLRQSPLFVRADLADSLVAFVTTRGTSISVSGTAGSSPAAVRDAIDTTRVRGPPAGSIGR